MTGPKKKKKTKYGCKQLHAPFEKVHLRQQEASILISAGEIRHLVTLQRGHYRPDSEMESFLLQELRETERKREIPLKLRSSESKAVLQCKVFAVILEFKMTCTSQFKSKQVSTIATPSYSLISPRCLNP